MSDNKALCIVICAALLCFTSCSVSEDWINHLERQKCENNAQGKGAGHE